MKLKKEYCRKLAAVGLITDGAVMKKKSRGTIVLEFYSNDKSMHKTFQCLMSRGFGVNKTCYFFEKNRVLTTGYEFSRNNKNVRYLMNLTPTYTTKKECLKIPTIRFLLDSDIELKQKAVRFAMSCEGCVSVAHKKDGKIVPSLKFACAHPLLVEEWKMLFEEVGIEISLDKDNANWSGLHGLITSKKGSIRKFKEIGGFFPVSVEVQGGNYKGLLKNKVLGGVNKWMGDKEQNIDRLILNE